MFAPRTHPHCLASTPHTAYPHPLTASPAHTQPGTPRAPHTCSPTHPTCPNTLSAAPTHTPACTRSPHRFSRTPRTASPAHPAPLLPHTLTSAPTQTQRGMPVHPTLSSPRLSAQRAALWHAPRHRRRVHRRLSCLSLIPRQCGAHQAGHAAGVDARCHTACLHTPHVPHPVLQRACTCRASQARRCSFKSGVGRALNQT
eukprot:361264-Chlamydomonas_euryale.AAC.3